MGLEIATYISDLVITNPEGAKDPKSQGDDHIRLVKRTLLTTFPNISGEVTATHTELNYVDGVTSAIQTQLNAKADASALDASNLTAGTVPDARFPATLPALNGSALTALNATALASGTVADARLSANVPLLDAANQFTVANQFRGGTEAFRMTDGTNFNGAYRNDQANWMTAQIGSSGYRWRNSSNSADVMSLTAAGVLTINGVAHTDFARVSENNTFTGSTNGQRANTFRNTNTGTSAYQDLGVRDSGSVEFKMTLAGSGFTSALVSSGPTGQSAALRTIGAVPISIATDNTERIGIGATGNFNFRGGTVTTNNASASEVGKTGVPSRTISSSTNTAASDQGGTIRMTGGSGQTLTLDSDVPADCFVLLDNASGNAWTIAASGTLTWAATGGTGNRTLANGGLAVALSLGSGNYKITGGGLT